MNDYDFGKYYRAKNRTPAHTKISTPNIVKIYKKLSIYVAAGLIVFFAGLMTGVSFHKNRIQQTPLAENTPGVLESSDISPNQETLPTQPPINPRVSRERNNDEIRSTLTNPENEYIILAKRYSEDSKDRALYYASVLKKIAKDENYDVIPSMRGRSIKLYVGPMKGRKNAEKMLARVKSLPEFTNSAILYKK